MKLHGKVPNRKRVFWHYMIMCVHNVLTVTDNVHNFNHRNCVLISFYFSTSNRFGFTTISHMNLSTNIICVPSMLMLCHHIHILLHIQLNRIKLWFFPFSFPFNLIENCFKHNIDPTRRRDEITGNLSGKSTYTIPNISF